MWHVRWRQGQCTWEGGGNMYGDVGAKEIHAEEEEGGSFQRRGRRSRPKELEEADEGNRGSGLGGECPQDREGSDAGASARPRVGNLKKVQAAKEMEPC